MKILRVMLLSLDGILFHRGQHSVGFFDSSLETNFTLLVKKGTVTLKCLSLQYLKLTLPRLKRHILIWNPARWPSDHSGTSQPTVYSVKMRSRMKFDLSFMWTLLMGDARSQWPFRGKETKETPPCHSLCPDNHPTQKLVTSAPRAYLQPVEFSLAYVQPHPPPQR